MTCRVSSRIIYYNLVFWSECVFRVCLYAMQTHTYGPGSFRLLTPLRSFADNIFWWRMKEKNWKKRRRTNIFYSFWTTACLKLIFSSPSCIRIFVCLSVFLSFSNLYLDLLIFSSVFCLLFFLLSSEIFVYPRKKGYWTLDVFQLKTRSKLIFDKVQRLIQFSNDILMIINYAVINFFRWQFCWWIVTWY